MRGIGFLWLMLLWWLREEGCLLEEGTGGGRSGVEDVEILIPWYGYEGYAVLLNDLNDMQLNIYCCKLCPLTVSISSLQSKRPRR